jgi:allantoinase
MVATACAASSASSSTRASTSSRVGEASSRSAMQIWPTRRAAARARRARRPIDRDRELAAIRARYATYLHSRPNAAEDAGDRAGAALCRDGARTHIVHHSSASALAAVARARDDGPAAHRGDVPALPALRRGDDPRRRDAVQVRAADPRAREPRALWRARRGRARYRRSDHSPCTPELKALEAGDFVAAWGGIAGCSSRCRSSWTERARARPRARRHRALDVRRARALAGSTAKGAIAAGTTRTSWCGRPTRVHVTPEIIRTATRSRRTRRASCAASCTRRTARQR